MSASAKKKLRKEQTAAQLTEKQLNQQKEAKKLKITTTIFVVAIAMVLVASLAIAGVNIYKGSGLVEKNTVALTIDDHKINAVEMSYYYNDMITTTYNTWQSSYGDSLSLYMSWMGLDLSAPLSQQQFDEETTWADYFIKSAAEKAKSDYLLCKQAKAEGFTMPEEDRAYLDSSIEQFDMVATLYGYSDVDSYLHSVYGPGASEDTYYAYSENAALAQAYYNAYKENMVIDDAAIRAYEADKFDEFSSFSYATFHFNYSDYLTGGTTNEDGTVTYTDAEKDAARVAMKVDAEALAPCATVEELNAAVAALPAYADSNPTATVFENSLYNTTSSAARQWLTDASRANGDFTVVSTTSSITNDANELVDVVNDYYAVIFLGRNDNNMPLANIRHILVKFEGGSTDESGNTVYSDAEKAAALTEAQAILDEFLAGEATNDSFAALASEKTDDTASAATGGLYEDITPEQGIYVEPFTNWAVDSQRKAGDTGIIETTYGYHVMYYVGDDDMTYRDYMITNQIRDENLNNWYNGIIESATAEVKDTSRLNKDRIISG